MTAAYGIGYLIGISLLFALGVWLIAGFKQKAVYDENGIRTGSRPRSKTTRFLTRFFGVFLVSAQVAAFAKPAMVIAEKKKLALKTSLDLCGHDAVPASKAEECLTNMREYYRDVHGIDIYGGK